ncbi:hypothetical protein MBAV_002137 [Candidatus Magnetobacterium bavaricum]|uniref:Lcl C-terminal domain-containing protein n=1 Tax=Candidatus Magnetobacterium bavaricum TaxID=29290 RepID=A0A0F3GUN7_9BACT|nr:hypothetical protein MBAV_002137 [Candidatus Magnetobacterium bavaricum]
MKSKDLEEVMQNMNYLRYHISVVRVLFTMILSVTIGCMCFGNTAYAFTIGQSDSGNRYLKVVNQEIPYGEGQGMVGVDTDALTGAESFTVDSGGNLYIADTVNQRIVALSSSGQYKYHINVEMGIYLSHIAVDNTGNIFMFDHSRRGLFQLANSDGKRIFAKTSVQVSPMLTDVQGALTGLHIVGNNIYISTSSQDNILVGNVTSGSLSSPAVLDKALTKVRGHNEASGKKYIVDLKRWEKGSIQVTDNSNVSTIDMPLKGVVSIAFLREDTNSNFYVQTERVENHTLILEVHQFDKGGNLVETLRIPNNDYYYWSDKLISVSDSGDIYQLMPGKDKATLNVYRQLHLSTRLSVVQDTFAEDTVVKSQGISTKSLKSTTPPVEKWDGGGTFGTISTTQIKTTAMSMITTPEWSPNVDIKNYRSPKVKYEFFYHLRKYIGEAYSQTGFCKPRGKSLTWNEFYNAVTNITPSPSPTVTPSPSPTVTPSPSPTATCIGNDCSAFVSISWNLPRVLDTSGFANIINPKWFYKLAKGSTDISRIYFMTGDVLTSRGSHIILVDYQPFSGVVSMEQTPPTARQKTWPWSQLYNYEPLRRKQITPDVFKQGMSATMYSDQPWCKDHVDTTCNGNIISYNTPVTLGTYYDDDGYRWWQIKDAKGNNGWMLEGYLEPKTKKGRFTDNGDGSMTDEITKLQWMKKADGCNGNVTWDVANTCVPSGWRLPTIQELYALCRTDGTTTGLDVMMNYDRDAPDPNPEPNWYCNGHAVDRWSQLRDDGFYVQHYHYWSSTTYALNTSDAWFVYMYTGGIDASGAKSSNFYVWPVRSGH